MKQTGGAENEKIANELLDGLHNIPESKNWGGKINGFPWTYVDDYTAIKAAQKANASVRSLDWTRAERLSLPDGTTSVPDFLGREIVIPVSVKSVVCAQKNRRHYIAAVKFSI